MDQSVETHYNHLYIHQKVLPNYEQIPLLLSTFILVIICLFFVWIKKVALAVKMVEISYSRKHECYYYDAMTFIWKNMTVIK